MTTEISFYIHYKIKGDNLDQCIAKARSLLKEDVGVDEYFSHQFTVTTVSS